MYCCAQVVFEAKMVADDRGSRPSQSLGLVACARSASAVLGKGAVLG